jgi:hypothetical protein
MMPFMAAKLGAVPSDDLCAAGLYERTGVEAAAFDDFATLDGGFERHAASLDDPTRYQPQAVTYRVRGYAWDHLDPALPKFDKMPPNVS